MPGLAAEAGIVVATYEYPERDRIAAVLPLAKLAEELGAAPAEIRLAESPTQLANWVATGSADVAVPNLVAYLAMRSRPGAVTDMVVPAAAGDGAPADASDSYTSSIVVLDSSPIRELAELGREAAPSRLYMVWPDSASGSLIARAELRQVLGEGADTLTMEFTGSHQAVFERIADGQPGVGVMATRVYLDLRAGGRSPEVRELWRSRPIPFGPLVCAASAKELCRRLRERLLEESAQSAAVLAGLKAGWPEFSTASEFAVPAPADYAELIDVYASSPGVAGSSGARRRQ